MGFLRWIRVHLRDLKFEFGNGYGIGYGIGDGAGLTYLDVLTRTRATSHLIALPGDPRDAWS